MRKILSVLLTLCMIMSVCTPFAVLDAFAEESVEIPVIEEVSEEELVELFEEEGEVELSALADFEITANDGVTYFTEVDGESMTRTGKAGEGDLTFKALFDGKYTDAANGDLGTTGYMGYCKEADATKNSVMTIDLGASRTIAGLRIYDSCRARSLDNRLIKTMAVSVSDDGGIWYALDNATRTVFDTGYGDFAFTKNSSAVNVTARYIKLDVTATATTTGAGGWPQYELEEFVLIDKVDANTTLDSDDFGATNVANVTAHAYVITANDGVTYLTELAGAKVTKVSGADQGNLASVYNGLYTTGVKDAAGDAGANDSFPTVNGAVEGYMGYYAGNAINGTTLQVDLGAVKEFSGIRLADDTKARGMKARKATQVSMQVSSDGEVWGNLDLAATTRTADYEPQHGDFNFSYGAEEVNVEARYIKFNVPGVSGGHGQFDIEEIIMLDADDEKDTITAADYDPSVAENSRDYYLQSSWFTAKSGNGMVIEYAGKSYTLTDWKPVSKLFDGMWHPEDQPTQANGGDDGNYWHSAANVSVNNDNKEPYVDLPAEYKTITITFNEAQKIGGFRVYPRVDNPAGNPKYVTVFASTDGSYFTKILDHVFVMNSSNKKPVEILVQTGVAYKALKFQIDENAGGKTNNNAAFCELQVLKPKKGYAYDDSVVQFTTTPAVTESGSTIGKALGGYDNLFDKVIYQFVNENEGYYNLWTGVPSGDPRFGADFLELSDSANKAWFTVDLGKEYTFSAARLFGRWNQPGQSVTKAVLYVSDNGTDWVELDVHSDSGTSVRKDFSSEIVKNDSSAATTTVALGKYNSTGDIYTDAKTKKEGVAYNVTARYIKVDVLNTSGNHLSIQEMLLVKPDDSNETKTVAELKALEPEVVLDDYYTNAADWTWTAGSEYSTSHGVAKLYDGEKYGNMGNCWHTATGLTDNLAGRTVTIMFDKAMEIGGVRIYPRSIGGGASPQYINIYGTYDGETWVKAVTNGKLTYAANTEEYSAVHLYTGRNNNFKGLKVEVVSNLDGGKDYTNFTELEVLKPIAPITEHPDDEVPMGYPIGTVKAVGVKTDSTEAVIYANDTAKRLEDGVVLNRTYLDNYMIATGKGDDAAGRDFQICLDWAIGGSNTTTQASASYKYEKAYVLYDMGHVEEFSGVRVYGRVNSAAYFTKGYVYVSEDGENWVRSDLISVASARYSTLNTKFAGDAYNIKARYIKVECTATNSGHWGLEEIRLLAPAEGVATKTPTEIQAAIVAKAEAVETLIAAIGTVTLDSKEAIKAAREAYDLLPAEVQANVENYATLTAAEAAYATLLSENLNSLIAEYPASEVTLDDAEAIAELREAYNTLDATQQAGINAADLEKAEAALAGLKKTINPTVADTSATSGKLGFVTLDYKLYTSADDVTVTGITYKGEAVTNSADEWKAVTNGDGTITLTLGGNYYKSEAHRIWLYDTTVIQSIKSHNNGGNYYTANIAQANFGIPAGGEITEHLFNGFFVRDLTNEGQGRKIITVSLSDGSTKDIALDVNYTWKNVSGSLATTDTDAITPTGWKVTTNGAASVDHASNNWFNGNYNDATNSQSLTINYNDATGTNKGTQHLVRAAGPYKIWIDFGKATKFAGVRLTDQKINITAVSLYGSDDLVTWTKLGDKTGNSAKTITVALEDNANYRYLRADIDGYDKMTSSGFFFLNEMVVLAPTTRILGGDINADLSEEVRDVERKFNSDNTYDITSVKVAGTELTKDTDYVLDGTKSITFKADWLKGLGIGTYNGEITFSSGEVVAFKAVVNDLSQVDYWLTKSSSPEGSQTLVLTNVTGKTVKSVAVKDGSSLEFATTDSTIEVNRIKFRQAINAAYEKLYADKAYGLKLVVTFDDDTTKEYTVNLNSEWTKLTDSVTTTFLADEVPANAAWAVRTDSANTPLFQVFLKAAKNTQHLQNWHTYFTNGQGDAPSGGSHYIDIDMGTAVTEVGGIRYVSRKNQADWGNVTISGSDDYATWTTLYTGNGTGVAGAYTMKFTQNSSFRYIRIKMANITHTTADTVHFLKPALGIVGDNVFKKDIKSTTEEITVKLEDLGTDTIKKVTLGETALTASQYVYDAEADTILIKAAALNNITTEGDVVLAIETNNGKVGSVTVKYMDFSVRLFPQEVLPYHFEHEAKIVSGIANGNISSITNRKITTKADGSALTNKDYAVTDLKLDSVFMIYSPKGTGASWNSAPGYFEVDYKIPHKFSGVRMYHRIWADKGVRQYFTTIREGYIAVSNDGVNWLKSDLQTFGAGNLDSLDYNRNAYDDLKLIIDGTAYNVEARYVRVYPTKNGAWEPIGIEEICLYEPSGSNPDVRTADLTPGAATFSLATLEDIVFEAEWNDAITLNTISIVTEEDELVPVNPAYYFCDKDTITISKYFFIDGGYNAGDVINFAIGFAVGADVLVPVTVADAEEYKINYESGENGTLKAVVRSTNMVTGEAVEREVASGEMVGRHENLVFVAEGNEGYEATGWTLEGKGADKVKYTKVTDKKGWAYNAINAKEPVSRAFDGNEKTYWHSDYTVPAGGSPVPTHAFADGPYWITVLFDEPMMIADMTHTRRSNADGTSYDAGQKAKNYKVWGTTDGGATYDVLLAEGNFVQTAKTDSIALADVGYIDGIKFEIYSTFASTIRSHCSVGEIGLTEKTITETFLSGAVTYTGSASQEYEIDDLFGEATVSVEFKKIASGTAKVSTDLKKLDAEIENTKVSYGDNAVITLTADENEELPEEISVLMSGVELKEGQDYTYDSATGEIVVKNVKGDIEILAVAKGVAVYTVTYKDENGATGTIPTGGNYAEGDKVTIAKSALKLSGSTFDGWKCSADGETYAAGDKFTMVAEDVTFTAVWKAKASSGEDEGTKKPSTGGSGGGSSTGGGSGLVGGGVGTGATTKVIVNIAGVDTQVAVGTVLADPVAPEGQEFTGWYLDAALTVPYANTGIIQGIAVYPGFRKIRTANELSDIAGHWAEKTVGEMYVSYLVNGTAEGKFEPDKLITRAEFCQILYLMSGQTTDGYHTFEDVNVGDWFTNAVAWAVKNGITQGTSETTFAPYESITREQMAVMIYRYATLMGHDWTISKEAGFADQADVAEYANYQVNWAADKKIINGYPDGTFAPKANATKAEGVTMLQRLLNLGK